MKIKTSVTLSPELIAALDRRASGRGRRSDFLEELAWEAMRERDRLSRRERDVALLNANAQFLNAEAEDFAELQSDFDGDYADAAR